MRHLLRNRERTEYHDHTTITPHLRAKGHSRRIVECRPWGGNCRRLLRLALVPASGRSPRRRTWRRSRPLRGSAWRALPDRLTHRDRTPRDPEQTRFKAAHQRAKPAVRLQNLYNPTSGQDPLCSGTEPPASSDRRSSPAKARHRYPANQPESPSWPEAPAPEQGRTVQTRLSTSTLILIAER